jgi:hypothetical protein
LIISAVAQNKTEKYLEDKYSWYASLNLGNAVGKYQKILEDANMNGTKCGIVVGGLMNPYKRTRASAVFYGAELGYQSNGQDEDFLSNAFGEFYVANHSFWANGMARYRPILWSSKLNSYTDAFLVQNLSKQVFMLCKSLNSNTCLFLRNCSIFLNAKEYLLILETHYWM